MGRNFTERPLTVDLFWVRRFNVTRWVGAGCGLLCLAACLRDESVAAYGGADQHWQLAEVGTSGRAVTGESGEGVASGVPHLSLRFQGLGRVTGGTACLSFAATNTAPYPWLALKSPKVTPKDGCTATPAESDLLSVLWTRSEVEVSGPYLALRGADGVEMSFQSRLTADVPERP